jgi:hypothetical protein
MKKLERIAKACHEVHNVLCKNSGQKVTPWEEKSEEHRETVKNSVKKILSGIIQSPQEAHMNFVFQKRKDGWVYGERHSNRKKVSPRLCDWNDLPEVERQKEEYFFAVASSFIKPTEEVEA